MNLKRQIPVYAKESILWPSKCTSGRGSTPYPALELTTLLSAGAPSQLRKGYPPDTHHFGTVDFSRLWHSPLCTFVTSIWLGDRPPIWLGDCPRNLVGGLPPQFGLGIAPPIWFRDCPQYGWGFPQYLCVELSLLLLLFFIQPLCELGGMKRQDLKGRSLMP